MSDNRCPAIFSRDLPVRAGVDNLRLLLENHDCTSSMQHRAGATLRDYAVPSSHSNGQMGKSADYDSRPK